MVAALLVLVPIAFARSPGQSRYDPSFEVFEREGAFEIRRYEPSVTAEATSTGDRTSAFESSLAALKAYAAGENAQSERISDTTPYMQTKAGAQWNLEFVIARRGDVSDAPTPRSARVRVRLQQSRLMAATAVTGGPDEQALMRAVDELRAFAERNGYEVSGSPAYAFHRRFGRRHSFVEWRRSSTCARSPRASSPKSEPDFVGFDALHI
jgi:hypothetical protein